MTGGIQEALRLARQAADGKDVRIGGGVQTVRQYLQAGLQRARRSDMFRAAKTERVQFDALQQRFALLERPQRDCEVHLVDPHVVLSR